MVIKIDYNKCSDAEKCGKCMIACPLGVFTKHPIGKFIPNKMPNKFEIVPFFEEICNGCRICVEICPKKCILLENR